MNDDPKRPWLVLSGLALGVCVTNGFARFAYGLILPAMQAELGWSYAEAGWLNTANALGYIAGAVLTMVLIGRMRLAHLFNFGLVATALSLFATGLYEPLWWQSLWRILAGLFGAMSFSTAGALAAALFTHDPRRNALAIALLFGFGGGLGIVLSGAALPLMIDAFGTASWPYAWIVIGSTAFLMIPLAYWSAHQVRPPGSTLNLAPRLPIRAMLGLMAGYAGFGLGYIVYFTFLSAWMTEQGFPALLISLVWVMLGICLCVSPFVWRPVFARSASGVPLALILSGIALGSVLPVLLPSGIGLILSAIVFGTCVFMSPSAVTNFIRRNLPAGSWGAAISLCTVVFAVSQTVGPYGAGLIGDMTGSLGMSLSAAGGVLLVGAALALMQRPLSQERDVQGG
jgi:predicted MFS family arabinose efflux permease